MIATLFDERIRKHALTGQLIDIREGFAHGYLAEDVRRNASAPPDLGRARKLLRHDERLPAQLGVMVADAVSGESAGSATMNASRCTVRDATLSGTLTRRPHIADGDAPVVEQRASLAR